MEPDILALTLARGLLRQAGSRFELRDGALVADGTVLDTFPAAPTEDVLARLAYLAHRLGLGEIDPGHLALAWQSALAARPHTRRELLDVARRLGHGGEGPLERWRDALLTRLTPTLDSMPHVDAFGPDTSAQARRDHLELRPLLEDWPRRLLNDREWAYVEAPLPEMEPLPLAQAWVDVDLVEPDELTFPTGRTAPSGEIGGESTVFETLDRRYEERAWRSEPADLLLERLGSSAALVGPPGSGKTTLLKWLARFLVTEGDGRFLLPLFVPLRAYVVWQERHSEGGLLDFALIRCGVRDPGQQKLWINALSYLSGVESEHVLLLLDGWDEVPAEKREALRAEIADLFYGFSTLVTSRPSAYPRNLPTDHFYEIAELSPEAVDVLVRRWFRTAEGVDGGADAVLRQIERRHDLRRMARNPFLLTLLCGIAHRESRNSPAELALPSCRTQIYARALELIFTHHNQRHPDAPLDAGRRRQTERLAFWLLAAAPEAPRYVFSRHDVVASGGDEDLLERHLKPARLLSQWNLGDDSHHFLHTTFHEYFAARALAREAPDRADARLKEHTHDVAWQEVLLFLAGDGGTAAATFWRAMTDLARRGDRLGLVWVRLARLVAEAAARDPTAAQDGGRALLGLDLRDRLWQGLLEMPINTPFVEAYAALDAAGFVARAEAALPTAGERERVRLLRALGRMRSPDAARSLVDQILRGDDNAAAVAFYQVYRRLDGKGLRRLRAAARDPAQDVLVRCRAVRALGHARDSLSVPWLVETACEDALAREVVQALGRIGGTEAVRGLANLLQARRDPELESAVFAVLGEVRDSGARDLLLTEVAGRPPDDPQLVEILDALCEIPIHRGAGVLLGILRGDGPSEVRRAAVWALMEASAFGVGDALAEAARREEDDGVRTAALHALEKRARPVDAGWLARRAADPERDDAERALALRALLLTVPRFAAEDEGERVRTLAAWQVREALKEPEDELALEAAIHAHHAGAEVGPRLVEIVRDEQAPGPLREMACGSLGRLRFQDAVEPLLALVRQEPDVETDEDLPEADLARRCARAAAEALVRIDVAALLGEPGTTAAHALARFSVETGCLVFDDRIVGPNGKVLVDRTEPDPKTDAGAGIEDESAAASVDLVLHVETAMIDGKTHLSYVLSSPSGKVPYTQHRIPGPPFPMTPAEYQANLFEGIEKLHSGVASDGSLVSDEEIGAELEKLGRELYRELFTSEMRAAYRAFRDRVETFLIVSYESWIPWELVKPYDDHDPERIVDDEFWGCRFQLTRWLAGETAPPATIAVRRLAVIAAAAPEDASALPHALKERDLLVDLARRYGIEGRSPPARFPEAESVLGEDGIGLFHFVGHGQLMPGQADLASFLLEGGRTLRPIDLQGEIATRLQRERPLVFLNACQMGRPDWARTRLGGWAPRWIGDCGCGAFVGPQWTVNDELAYRFAKAFYSALLEGVTFGRAGQAARESLGSMAMAFAVYGHPAGCCFAGKASTATAPQSSVDDLDQYVATPLPKPRRQAETRLFGVDSALRQLRSYLVDDENSPVVSIEGLGGLGKTALATNKLPDPEDEGIWEEQNVLTEWWKNTLRSILRKEIPRQLNGIAITNRRMLKREFDRLLSNPSFAKSVKAQSRLHRQFESTMSNYYIGISNADIRKELDEFSPPATIYFPPIMLATSAIFVYLRDKIGCNLKLDYQQPHALAIASQIKGLSTGGSSLLSPPDVCVMGDAPGTALQDLPREPFYEWQMFMPPSEQRVVAPRIEGHTYQEKELLRGEFFFPRESEIPSTTQFHLEHLRRIEKVCLPEIRGYEPNECLDVLREGDADCRSILWTPHLQIYGHHLGACEIIDNYPIGGQIGYFFQTMLYFERAFSFSRRAQYLRVAIRNAWFRLKTDSESREQAISLLLDDDDYVFSLMRICGIENQE